MKKILTNLISVLSLVLFIASFICSSLAVSTDDAKEPIDITTECSLKLTYGTTEPYRRFEGLQIELFRVAELSESYVFTKTAAFEYYNVELNLIKSQSEWNAVCDTLNAIIIGDGISPFDRKTTDGEGVVIFENLKAGLYFVRWLGDDSQRLEQGFDPFVISLPGLNDNGLWNYYVEAYPKPGDVKVGYEDYKVVKHWADAGDVSGKTVTVELFKNGVSEGTISLNEGNNWTYSWAAEKGDSWTVLERDSGEYKVTVEQRENSFIITNTGSETPYIPPTGDTSRLSLWIIIMAASGVLFVALGIISRVKQ